MYIRIMLLQCMHQASPRPQACSPPPRKPTPSHIPSRAMASWLGRHPEPATADSTTSQIALHVVNGIYASLRGALVYQCIDGAHQRLTTRVSLHATSNRALPPSTGPEQSPSRPSHMLQTPFNASTCPLSLNMHLRAAQECCALPKSPSASAGVGRHRSVNNAMGLPCSNVMPSCSEPALEALMPTKKGHGRATCCVGWFKPNESYPTASPLQRAAAPPQSTSCAHADGSHPVH